MSPLLRHDQVASRPGLLIPDPVTDVPSIALSIAAASSLQSESDISHPEPSQSNDFKQDGTDLLLATEEEQAASTIQPEFAPKSSASFEEPTPNNIFPGNAELEDSGNALLQHVSPHSPSPPPPLPPAEAGGPPVSAKPVSGTPPRRWNSLLPRVPSTGAQSSSASAKAAPATDQSVAPADNGAAGPAAPASTRTPIRSMALLAAWRKDGAAQSDSEESTARRMGGGGSVAARARRSKLFKSSLWRVRWGQSESPLDSRARRPKSRSTAAVTLRLCCPPGCRMGRLPAP